MTEYAYADSTDKIVEMAAKDTTGTLGGMLRERVTSGFPTITTDHAFIHEGIAWTLSGVVEVDAAYSIAFTTPATKYVHFKPVGIAASGGPLTVTLVEGPTFTGGTDGAPRNRNRLGETPDANPMATKLGVTPTGGTTIATLYVPSATQGAQRLGGAAASAEEHVLKRSTVYTINFAETSAGNVFVGYDIFWYVEAGA
jgi:hypothetical protein